MVTPVKGVESCSPVAPTCSQEAPPNLRCLQVAERIAPGDGALEGFMSSSVLTGPWFHGCKTSPMLVRLILFPEISRKTMEAETIFLWGPKALFRPKNWIRMV